MEDEQFDEEDFKDFQKNLLESYKKYKMQEYKIKLLKNDNKNKEAKIKKFMNEKVDNINPEIYKSYDLLQKDEIEMEVEKYETESTEKIKMFEKFKEYINQIDIISDNIGSIENHDEGNNDIRKLLDSKDINDIINHEFGKNIKKNKFLEAFGKAISKNVNKNWIKKDRIDFRDNLESIIDSKIKEIFFDTIPSHIIQLRMDNLLCTVLTKVYNTSNKAIEYLITQESTNYSTNPLEKGIEFINPENKKKYLFNKRYIKNQINNNVGINNAYYKLIQKFITNKYNKTQLKKDINDIIDKTNIYFCDLPKKVLGITICNGDIFITGKYLQEALHNSPNNKYYNSTAVSKIFLNLLHEIAHKLQYTIRKNYIPNDNYFIKTFYFKNENDFNFDKIEKIKLDVDANNFNINKNIKLSNAEIDNITKYNKLHDNITRCESGEFFDNEIYLGKEQKFVTKSISNFFLFYACQDYNDYVYIMKSFLDKIYSSDERTTNCNYKIIDDQKIYCYHSLVRGYYN